MRNPATLAALFFTFGVGVGACVADKGTEPNDTGSPDTDTAADTDDPSESGDTGGGETSDTGDGPSLFYGAYVAQMRGGTALTGILRLHPDGQTIMEWEHDGCRIAEGLEMSAVPGGWSVFYKGISVCSIPACDTPWGTECVTNTLRGEGDATREEVGAFVVTDGLFEQGTRGDWSSDVQIQWVYTETAMP